MIWGEGVHFDPDEFHAAQNEEWDEEEAQIARELKAYDAEKDAIDMQIEAEDD